MPPFGPISRKDLIRHLRTIGFDGPYSGGKHSFMIKENLTLTIPNQTKATSGASCWPVFCARRGSAASNGNN
jgi:predicted RNA binding protein YcfA (HicA-like mRNA interferase family)